MNILNKLKSTNQNNQIIIKNTLGAFIIRGASLIVSILTTPAFIKYFNNNEVLGVWFTLLSILTWVLNFDLGIGNGIRNQLVQDFTKKDFTSARCTISSGFFSIGILSLILFLAGIFTFEFIDLNALFNIEASLLPCNILKVSTIAIFSALILRFFLTTVSSIFYAMQKSAINNFLSLCIAILQLLYVKVFHFSNVANALLNLSIAYVLISNLPVIIAGIVIFLKPLKFCRPQLSAISKNRINIIIKIGSLFFLCQILYMCIANTNEFLITFLYGAECTTEYTFYYKLMSIISMLISLALTPVWSVVTKAVTERDYDWLTKLYKRIKKAGLLVLLAQFLIIPFMQFILNLWLGKGTVHVQISTAIAFALFFGFFAYSGMLSTFANGMARMRVQAVAFSIGVCLKFALSFLLYRHINSWNLIIWSNIIAFIPYILWQQLDLNKYLTQKQILKK